MNNHSHIAQASKVVSEKLGLYFPENRYQDLSAGLHEASKELGFEEDGTTFISLLIEQKLSNKQLDILAEKLTIGETYFFREKQILTAFREMIIPSLVKKKRIYHPFDPDLECRMLFRGGTLYAGNDPFRDHPRHCFLEYFHPGNRYKQEISG